MDKKSRTIQREISKLFLVLAVVISAVLLTYTTTTINKILEEHAAEDMQAAVQTKSEAIVVNIKSGISLIDQISNETRMRSNLLAAVSPGNDYQRFGASQRNIDKDLEVMLMSSDNLEWVEVYDADFDMVAQAGKNEWFKDSNARADAKVELHKIGDNENYKVGKFYQAKGGFYSNVITSIRHPENRLKIIGYMVAAIRCPCGLNDYEKYSMFGKTGEFVIAQQSENQIIVLSKQRHQSSQSIQIKPIGSLEKNNILRSAFKGVGGSLTGFDYRNEEVVGSYVFFPEFELAVISKIDSAEIFEYVEMVFAKIVLILVIAIAIAYYIVSKRLGRALAPVSELEHGARRFSLGELNYRIPIYGNNELSHLTRLFNGMAEKLDKVTSSRDELDRQVEIQREIERQLHEERSKLEAIFETNEDSVVVWDEDYQHIYVNRAAAQVVGLTKRSMIGKTIAQVFADTPDAAEFWMNRVKQVFMDGEKSDFSDEFDIQGRHIYAEYSIAPIVNESDEVIAAAMVFRDITQRKLAEESAHASWQMLHQVIDSIPVSVFWKDKNSTFLGANMNLAKGLGFNSPEELIGKTDYDISSKEIAEDYRRDDQEVMESKQPKLNYEERFQDEDGNEIIINTSKVPLMRSDGSVYGVLGCFVDVTEQHNFIKKLKDAQRNADLANKSKSDFLASMSHEIRTPINAMTGMADVLLQTGVSSSQAEYIKILKAAGENLSHLVSNILDYTKVEAGELELHNEEFSLGDALNDSVNLVMLKTHEKNIYMNMDVDEEVQLKLYGDSGKLKQIVLNLLNNAAKFTNTGGIELKVSEWQHPTPGKYMLLFEVIDTGPGIPADKLETIFDRFMRLDGGVHDSDSQSGAGLGLSICQELVFALGGQIWVDSELDKGSKFSFTASFKPMDELKVIRHQPSGKLSLRGTLAKVCCNDPDLSEQMIQNLEDWKIRVKHTTESTEQCLNEDSDFIILMPDAGMIDCIVEKYQKSDLEQIASKVIVIPQQVEAEQLEKLKTVGLMLVLQQPVVRKDLYERLDNIHKQKDDSSKISGNNKFTWYDPARVRILIADDDPITKKVMRLAFENLGYRIDIASNGYEVLNYLKKESYDIIFMDTDMPDMDGNETTRLIREQEGDTGIPIVAVTAKVFDEDRKRAFDSGIDWFLPKPVIVEQMVEAINKLVKLD